MGGAIFLDTGTATVSNSSFETNEATGGQGGGSGMGGGIFVNTGSVTVVECSFAGNSVTGGAATGADFFNHAGRAMPQLTATSLGGGTVGIDPPVPPYLSNSWATLTASPAPGWQFLYWLGDVQGTNRTASVRVTRNKCVQAVFGTPVTVSALLSVNPQSDLYPYGTLVKLTALPPPGTYFTAWSRDASGTTNPFTLIITNPNPSVGFQLSALGPGQVALTRIETGRGHISASPASNYYATGQAVTLTPTPDAGQDFLGWSGAATGTQTPLSLTMSESKVIIANFTTRPSLNAV